MKKYTMELPETASFDVCEDSLGRTILRIALPEDFDMRTGKPLVKEVETLYTEEDVECAVARGKEEGWNVAKTIVSGNYEHLVEIFGNGNPLKIIKTFREYGAEEAIRKWKEKTEAINVGDIVLDKNGNKLLVTCVNDVPGSPRLLNLIYDGGGITMATVDNVQKTTEHIDLTAILNAVKRK